MSASIISNNLYRFIQDIEQLYVAFKKTNPKATYQTFYDYLNKQEADEQRETLKEHITMKVMDICYKITKIQEIENEVAGNRLDSLDVLRGSFVFIYIILTIIFVVVCVLVGKAYKHDLFKASKMILTFVLIYLFVTTLFILFTKYINQQKRTVSSNFNEVMKSIRSYKDLMHNNTKHTSDANKKSSMQTIANGDVFIKGIAQYREQRKKQKMNTSALMKQDKMFLSELWKSYVSRVIQIVHNYGTGFKSLKVVEISSSNIKILKGVNKILGPYYDVMLKSRQNFADASTKDGIMKIIDATVIKELSNVDVFSLEDNTVLRDPVFISKMEDGEHYKVLMKGFMHLIVYLYPVYKNVSYEKLVLLEKEEEALKNNSKDKTQNPSLTDADKKVINKAMLEDPVLTQVRNTYPLVKDNFKEEIEIMKRYDQSDTTKDRVEVVQNFVSDTVLAFNAINDMENDKYLRMMNNTPSPSQTQILMTNYAKTFHTYFEKLYKNFIRLELAKLDPKSSQYFIFNPVYMKDKLNTYVKSTPIIRDLEPNFIKMMVNIIVDDLVAEQKSRYISSYFSYEKDKEKSLKAHVINGRMVELIQRVAPALTPYEFKVSDYAKYIISKLSNNPDNISTNVSSAIETLLTNIDYEVAIQKGIVSSTLSDVANEMRYVAIHDFVYNIDQYKFNTLYNALQPEILKELVTTIKPESSEVFAGREFKRQIAEVIMKMLIIFLVVAYILYAIILVEKKRKNTNVFTDENTNPNVRKLNAILQGDAIWGNVFKFGVPLTGSVLFISIFNSYVVKAKDNIEFNKGLMRENTEDIQQSVDELNKILDSINMSLTIEQSVQSIGDIKDINIETKQKLYNVIKNILITYDKCNYIVGIDKYDIPFPYAEVLTDGVMSIFILGLIVYSISKFAPLTRVVELKDLYEYKESSQTLVNDPTFVSEIMTKGACHKDEVDGVMYTVKAIATMSILVFMVMYSLQIINSTSEYRGGLYKSPLYENKKCAS
jgi:energy-coupling factor transporter transmembrane protein EcfT